MISVKHGHNVHTYIHIYLVYYHGQYRGCRCQSGDKKVPAIRSSTASVTASSWWCVYRERNGENPGIKGTPIILKNFGYRCFNMYFCSIHCKESSLNPDFSGRNTNYVH